MAASWLLTAFLTVVLRGGLCVCVCAWLVRGTSRIMNKARSRVHLIAVSLEQPICPSSNGLSPPETPSLPLSLLYVCQRQLRLREPERHVHGAIHLDGRGQHSTGLLPLAGLGIQRAKATVTMGQKLRARLPS